MKNLRKFISKNSHLRYSLLILSLLLLILFFSYQVFRSYETLHITHYSIESDILSSNNKFVVLSDLHDHEFGIENEGLVLAIQDIAPDCIFMVGDFINEGSQDASVLLNLVEKLSDIAPVYFSLGNHEIAYMNRTGEDLITKINDAGAKVLDLEYEEIEVGEEWIRIGGMYDYAFALDGYNSTNPETMDVDVYNFLTDFQNTDYFKIMMAHRPDSFVLGEASKTWKINLVISGHAHGGQVVLPFVGGLWAPEQGWFPQYVHGLYQKDKINLFITSGLGSHSETIPRFNNPPEIAVIVIKNARN